MYRDKIFNIFQVVYYSLNTYFAQSNKTLIILFMCIIVIKNISGFKKKKNGYSFDFYVTYL